MAAQVDSESASRRRILFVIASVMLGDFPAEGVVFLARGLGGELIDGSFGGGFLCAHGRIGFEVD